MKSKTKFVSGVCLLAIALGAPSVVSARTKASPSPAAGVAPTAKAMETAASTTKPRAIPFHGMIASVATKAKSFTIAGKEATRTFVITDNSVLSKAGQPATMKDVVANEEVRGSYWKKTDGTLEAKSVKLGPLTEAEKAAKEARKEKRAEKKAAASPEPSPSR